MKSRLDKVLATGTQNDAAPGAVAIVVDRNEVLWEGASGKRAVGTDAAMTTDTVGAIFSMTKAVTGAAAMQLVEQGRLDLDAPAGNICPWLNEVQVLDGFADNGEPVLRAPKSPVNAAQPADAYLRLYLRDMECKRGSLERKIRRAQFVYIRKQVAGNTTGF